MLSSEDMNGLVALVEGGDQRAFAQLFDYFAPRIAAYLGRVGTPPAVAEELAQEAMVMVWRKADTFDASRAAVSTWIFAIARNLRIDRHRREVGENRALDRNSAFDDNDVIDHGPRPEECMDASQRERRVRAAMRRLSPQQAHLLQLSFFAESPHSDIARDLCMPLGTVKSNIRRALLNMRRFLEASET